MSAILVKFVAHLAAPYVELALFSKRQHWALRFLVAVVLSLVSLPLFYLGFLSGIDNENWLSWFQIRSPALLPLLTFFLRSRREGERQADRGLKEPLRVLTLALLAILALGGVSRVHGRVLDAETGQPLWGVERSVRAHDASLLPWSRSYEPPRRGVSEGGFVTACWLCESLEVRFSKKGYHSATIRPELIAWSLIPTERSRRRDVELVPIGDLATLEVYSGRLVLASDPEDSRVLPLIRSGGSGVISPSRVRGSRNLETLP